MLYIDIDNTCLDFTGTLERHFGIKLEPNDFDSFHWQDFSPNIHCEKCRGKHGGIPTPCKFPAPQEFYAKAELVPWFKELFEEVERWESNFNFITKDYVELKKNTMTRFCGNDIYFHYFIEAPDKSEFCKHPCDLLLDDNPAECEAWRAKGGLAFRFDNSKTDIFEQFLKWWRLETITEKNFPGGKNC